MCDTRGERMGRKHSRPLTLEQDTRCAGYRTIEWEELCVWEDVLCGVASPWWQTRRWI